MRLLVFVLATYTSLISASVEDSGIDIASGEGSTVGVSVDGVSVVVSSELGGSGAGGSSVVGAPLPENTAEIVWSEVTFEKV